MPEITPWRLPPRENTPQVVTPRRATPTRCAYPGDNPPWVDTESADRDWCRSRRHIYSHPPPAPNTSYEKCKYNFTVRVISFWSSLPIHVITAEQIIGWISFGLMRKHILTTRPSYLAVVLQDASKSYVAFLLLCTIV